MSPMTRAPRKAFRPNKRRAKYSFLIAGCLLAAGLALPARVAPEDPGLATAVRNPELAGRCREALGESLGRPPIQQESAQSLDASGYCSGAPRGCGAPRS